MATTDWMRTMGGVVLASLLAACASSAPSSTSAEPQPPAAPTAGGNPADPCTLLSADDINSVLGSSVGSGDTTEDSARQIATCRFTTSDMTGIVDLGVSQIDGDESYGTNRDLAPAYFGGDPTPVDIPGADKAYLVIADTYDAPVVGMLVGRTFVLLQVGIEGTTPEQGEALAAQVASRL